jgi:hypothetical protein
MPAELVKIKADLIFFYMVRHYDSDDNVTTSTLFCKCWNRIRV